MEINVAGQRGANGGAFLGALRALAVDRVTAEVVPALSAAGIPAILLKGPSIARWLYPAGGRTYVDTDLLVPPGEMGRAREVLEHIGFTEALAGFHPVERAISMCPVESQFLRPGTARTADLVSTEKVDLHRNLPKLPAPDRLLWETFLANSQTMPIGDIRVRVLTRPALGLHIVLHALQHWFGAHTSEDLRRLLAEMPPDGWRTAASLARQLGAEDLLALGLRHHPGGAEIADRLGLPRNPIRDWLAGAPRGSQSLAGLRAADGTRARLRSVRWMMLPSPAKIRYVARRPDASGPALALGYIRWWRGLVRSFLPAARFVRIGQRRPGGTDAVRD